jgi:hypothetical protein
METGQPESWFMTGRSGSTAAETRRPRSLNADDTAKQNGVPSAAGAGYQLIGARLGIRVMESVDIKTAVPASSAHPPNNGELQPNGIAARASNQTEKNPSTNQKPRERPHPPHYHQWDRSHTDERIKCARECLLEPTEYEKQNDYFPKAVQYGPIEP